MDLSPNALNVATKRYLWEDETWEHACYERIGGLMAQREQDSRLWRDKFGEIIYNREFLPGGRILRNSGRHKGNLGNCFNVPLDDNINSIGEFIKSILILWKHGGGIGTLGDLRPKGAPLVASGGVSSGLISFAKAFDAIGSTIESGGQRRAAGLIILLVSHPELFEFLDAKLQNSDAAMSNELKEAVKMLEKYLLSTKPNDEIVKAWVKILAELTKKLSHFNLSVGITNQFLDAVERGNGWEFKYGNRVYNEMPARDIWLQIVRRMVQTGEPGLINWNNFTKNNTYYFAPITGTNACSELCLEDWGICNLGALCLPRFIVNKNLNQKRFEEVIRIAVRFMDNVIDQGYYVLPRIEETAKNARRVGIGIMGLSDYFFLKEIRYGSQKSLNELERIWTFIRDIAYDESVKIAEEKGAFPKFDPVSYGKASYIRKLPISLRHAIKKRGIRNATLLAGAPTGTTSQLADVNSGHECLYAKAYKRVDNITEKPRYFIHPIYRNYLKGNVKELPEWFVDAHDVKPQEHLDIVATAIKKVDSNISKTINLPKGTKSEKVSDLLLEYIWDLKGVTVYVDESRDEQVLYPLSKKEAKKHLDDSERIPDFQCLKSGACEI